MEELKAGDLVYSRDEHDPAGPITAKVVEEVFARFAGVYNLHVGGQVIGTSGEHPFYVVGKGWTAAFELRPGDRIATADGVGVVVDEIWDTGEWEPVYNLRVAEWHTYFVGDESWGWAAWAHNQYYYHATSDAAAQSIIGSGVSLAFSSSKLDFGKGFYTTTDEKQAWRWANQKFPGQGQVVVFNLDGTDLAGLSFFTFAGVTPEWKETVWSGRRGILDDHPLSIDPHYADVVAGPFLTNPSAMR